MRFHRSGLLAWGLGLVLSLGGLGLVAWGSGRLGAVAVAAGAFLLASRGLWLAARRARAAGRPARERLGAGCVAVAAGLLLAAHPGLPVQARVVAGAVGAQVLLGMMGRDAAGSASRFRRWALPAVGHATALVGSLLALAGGGAFTAAVGLAYASGFSVLVLHAHWMQRVGPALASRADGWEVAVLGSIVVGVGAMTLLYAGGAGILEPDPALARAVAFVSLACAALGVAFLAGPPEAPAALRTRAGIVLDVLAHGGAAIAMLNVLFLGFSLVSGWSLKAIFGILFGWQLVVVSMDFRTLRHAERRRRRPRPVMARPAHPEAVTVIVPAANEAQVLPESMAHNLAVPYPLRFILVPATKSTDRTREVARGIAARHPDRVVVMEGSTGSKAEDLNLAWRLVETPFVLLLDADETIDEESLLRGLAVLRQRPEVGIVQGRKVSKAPEDGWLARFVNAERRYCTWMDHVMHGEELGSSHFGGSAALLRREVPPSVGGWTDQTMTEDIEFTLRIHLDGRWTLVYHPEMVVRESDPATLQDLLRQRTRWARGWAQCFALYFPKVVEQRRRLGRAKAFGLVWLLLITVSALWTTFVPATLLMRLAGVSPLLPVAIAIPLSLILLPGRLLTYGYAAVRDPVIPVKLTPLRFAELAVHAYLWILLGWFIQLHALYLELSSAPRVWYVTGKRTRRLRVTASRAA